ncbi:right-handed parallel beta-helix repeat-containing protein, partial [Thermodesulfobacteriota bacterium]
MVLASGDGDYTDGENYKATLTALDLGSGNKDLNYLFYATDGTDPAIGDPALNEETVTIVDTSYKVRSSGGTGWYDSIQTAIGSNDDITILVYEGSYTPINLTERSDVVVQSVCGPDVTTITGSGNLVFFQNSGSNTIDGFTLSGGTNGVAHNSTNGTTTIKNCKIDSTSNGVSFTANSGKVDIENSEIYGNTTGIYITAQYNNHQITDTVIRDNGTGIFLQNTSATFTRCTIRDNTNGGFKANSVTTPKFYQSIFLSNSAATGGAMTNGHSDFNLTMENCIIANNQATGDDGYGNGGGAFFFTGGNATFTNCTIADNTASTSGGGMAFFQNTNITMEDTIIWNNSAAGSGQIVNSNSAGSIIITDTVMSNDGDSDFTNSPYFTGSLTPTVSGYISESDPNFINNAAGDYHIQDPSDAIDNGSTDLIVDFEGDVRPQNVVDDMGADEVSSATSYFAPVLSWTGETDYESDGINPDSGNGGEIFVFRVDYTDMDNNPPVLIQVWIDEDDSGTYGPNEKFNMAEVDSGDTVYTDSKRYTFSRVLNYTGDGTLKFRFYALDGVEEATGDPTALQSLSLTNNIPVLSWIGVPYENGVDPDSGEGGTTPFTFRVKYTDGDNIAPNPVQVWVDTDNSGVYDVHEKFDMTWVDDGEKDYTDGEKYTVTLSIPYIGDGNITYRFYASDGFDTAIGEPVSDTAMIITPALPANNVPVLSWAIAECLSNGVRPPVGAEQVDFEFKVIYTDANDECPSDILLLIDEDDSGTYESDEKYLMTTEDSTNCDVGRLYEITLNLVSAGDGDLNYRFYATDGNEAATGIPVESDSTVTVIDDPIKVRPTGGAGWFSTLLSAEDNSFTGDTILVYP